MPWSYEGWFKPSGTKRVHLAVTNDTPSVTSDNSLSFSYNSNFTIDYSVGVSDAVAAGLDFSTGFQGSIETSYGYFPSCSFEFASEAPAMSLAWITPGVGAGETEVSYAGASYQGVSDTMHLVALGDQQSGTGNLVSGQAWSASRIAFTALDVGLLVAAMVAHGVVQAEGHKFFKNVGENPDGSLDGGIGARKNARATAETLTAGIPAAKLAVTVAKIVFAGFMFSKRGTEISPTTQEDAWLAYPGLLLRNSDQKMRTLPNAGARLHCGTDSFIEVTNGKVVICAKTIELRETAPTTVGQQSPAGITMTTSTGPVTLNGKTFSVSTESGTDIKGDVTAVNNVTVKQDQVVKGNSTVEQTSSSKDSTSGTSTVG